MNQIAMQTAAAALVLSSAVMPAQADVMSDIQTKIDGAMKTARSFVITTQYPAQAYSSTLVYVAPDRYRVAVAIAASTTDVITVGTTSYSSKNGAPFEKAALTPDELARMKQIGQVKVSAAHSDVVVDGVAYGAFDATAPAGLSTALTCTYDKQSFRLVRCAADDWTQTYNAYDDPKNVVAVPTGGK